MQRKAILAAAAIAGLCIAGAGGIAATGANAATPSCGSTCIDIYNSEFGPSYVLDDYRQGQSVGSKAILYQASNIDPAEDFTISNQGTVAQFKSAGLVSSALNLHYSKYEAYEIAYSPDGVSTGLCLGTAAVAADDTPVSLQPCGASSKTVWVVDYIHGNGHYADLINGSDTNFSQPYVLHYPGFSNPGDQPRPQLTTYTLQQYSNGAVYDNELWNATWGTAGPGGGSYSHGSHSHTAPGPVHTTTACRIGDDNVNSTLLTGVTGITSGAAPGTLTVTGHGADTYTYSRSTTSGSISLSAASGVSTTITAADNSTGDLTIAGTSGTASESATYPVSVDASGNITLGTAVTDEITGITVTGVSHVHGSSDCTVDVSAADSTGTVAYTATGTAIPGVAVSGGRDFFESPSNGSGLVDSSYPVTVTATDGAASASVAFNLVVSGS